MMRAVWQCRQLQDIRPPGLSRGGQRLPARESRKQAVSTHTHASPAPLQLSLAMSSCLTALQRLPHAPCVPVRCPARHAPAGPGRRACPLMMMRVPCPARPPPSRSGPGAWRLAAAGGTRACNLTARKCPPRPPSRASGCPTQIAWPSLILDYRHGPVTRPSHIAASAPSQLHSIPITCSHAPSADEPPSARPLQFKLACLSRRFPFERQPS